MDPLKASVSSQLRALQAEWRQQADEATRSSVVADGIVRTASCLSEAGRARRDADAITPILTLVEHQEQRIQKLSRYLEEASQPRSQHDDD